MKNIFLIGGGGHCVSVLDVIETTKKFKVIGFVDQNPTNKYVSSRYKYLGNDKVIEALILEYKNKIKKKIFIYLFGILFLSLWIEYLTYFIEIIFNTNISKIKNNNLSLSNYIYAFSILFKNIIYWLLNINLILISTNLLFRKN